LGARGIVVDVLAPVFLTGLLLTLIVTPLLRGRIRKGGVPNIAPDSLPSLFDMLPQHVLLRGGMMGLGGLLILASLLIGLFWVTGTTHLSPVNFIWIKGVYGAVIGTVFTTLVLLPMLAGKIK
jgi:hypothetical protein